MPAGHTHNTGRSTDRFDFHKGGAPARPRIEDASKSTTLQSPQPPFPTTRPSGLPAAVGTFVTAASIGSMGEQGTQIPKSAMAASSSSNSSRVNFKG
jgi:hypothetical protein